MLVGYYIIETPISSETNNKSLNSMIITKFDNNTLNTGIEQSKSYHQNNVFESNATETYNL